MLDIAFSFFIKPSLNFHFIGYKIALATDWAKAVSVPALLYKIKSGALAQLGARHIRIVEVTGSNPVCSTFLFLLNISAFYEI